MTAMLGCHICQNSSDWIMAKGHNLEHYDKAFFFKFGSNYRCFGTYIDKCQEILGALSTFSEI